VKSHKTVRTRGTKECFGGQLKLTTIFGNNEGETKHEERYDKVKKIKQKIFPRVFKKK
jgi:hypothetical protein